MFDTKSKESHYSRNNEREQSMESIKEEDDSNDWLIVTHYKAITLLPSGGLILGGAVKVNTL